MFCGIFFVGYEVFERMAYYGIASNLVLYLTRELHEGTVSSSNNVTNWSGTVWLTPILGAYIADAYLGRYWTFIIASVIYLVVILDIHMHAYIETQTIHIHIYIYTYILVVQGNRTWHFIHHAYWNT